MAKGRWKRDPLTGLTRKELDQVPDERLTMDMERVDLRAYLDCNIFKPQEFADAAGYKDQRYFLGKVLTDSRSYFHAHQLKAENGRTLRFFTHSNSATFGGQRYRAETLARQTGFKPDPEKPMLLPIRSRFSESDPAKKKK